MLRRDRILGSETKALKAYLQLRILDSSIDCPYLGSPVV